MGCIDGDYERNKKYMVCINVVVGVLGLLCLAIASAGFVIYPHLNFFTCCMPRNGCGDLGALERAVNVGFSGEDFFNRAIAERDPTTNLCVLFGASPLLRTHSGGDYGCSSDLALDASQYHQRPQPSEDQFINTSSWAWNKTCVPESVAGCGGKTLRSYHQVASGFLVVATFFCGVAVFGSAIIHKRIVTFIALVAMAISGIISLAVAVLGVRNSVSFDGVTIPGSGSESDDSPNYMVGTPGCPARYAGSYLVEIGYLLPFERGTTVPDPNRPVYTQKGITWLIAMHIVCGALAFLMAGLHFFMTRVFDNS